MRALILVQSGTAQKVFERINAITSKAPNLTIGEIAEMRDKNESLY